MDMMGWNYMFLTSPEKLWEFHNRTAQEIRNLLGDNAPKVGGMTWGEHDFQMLDWQGRRPASFFYDNSTPDIYPVYDNILKSYNFV